MVIQGKMANRGIMAPAGGVAFRSPDDDLSTGLWLKVWS